MAPSRGLISVLRTRIPTSREYISVRRYSDFTSAAADPASTSRVYISRSNDPYLNLSIEHYILQKSALESKVLFLYTNRPSVIIGRNQNPWVEANIRLLQQERFDLVRRRSGGGTVFHDEGNVNYSVICPTSMFDRDKHAEMVVRALQSVGARNTRVNKRHDIVQDRNGKDAKTNNPFEGELRPFKISGSAYKLTRLRSLHHGTCLLSAPNLGKIGHYLKAPAKPYITARGVESVPSEIANVAPHIPNEAFIQAVSSEFVKLYGQDEPAVEVSEDDARVSEVMKGYEELKSPQWIYGQTPQFTYARHNDGNLIEFTARNGVVTEVEMRSAMDSANGKEPYAELVSKALYDTEEKPAERWVKALLE